VPATELARRDGVLHLEGVGLAEIARACGTPCYVYSRAAIERAWRAYARAFPPPHGVHYAVKANGNLALLALLARLGAGFDVVSGGELARVLRAGADPARVVFSGVGKSAAELQAALAAGIGCINVESAGELERLSAIANARGVTARVALRVNPLVDARTHPYIATGLADSKFGIPWDAARALYARAAALPGLAPVGLACHIGSQLTELAPLREAAGRMAELALTLRADGVALEHLDLGGGLGIAYRDETPPDIAAYAGALRDAAGACGLPVHVEPGRSLIGPAGVLLTRVEYLKPGAPRAFAVVDAAMTELIRPALYDAWHGVLPVTERAGAAQAWDIVGPVCESGDWLARDRALCLEPGDLLAIGDAGAYGFAMASNYNARPRPPEVLVEGEAFRTIRAREALEELWRGEAAS
jgi:diaminopimelate decarboxylase